MAMNKQRKTSDLANVVVTDATNNVTLPNNLSITALISAGLVKADSTGKLVAATAGTDYVTGNIYTTDGTLTGNRTLTSGGYNLTFTGTNVASGAIARGILMNHTLTAAANNDVLVGLDINPTFTNGAFTGVTNLGLRITTDGAGGGVLGGLLVRTSGGTTLFSVDRQYGIVYVNNQLRTNVLNNSSGGNQIYFSGNNVNINGNGSGNVSFFLSQFGTELLRMYTSTGNLLIQTGGTFTDAGYKLDVQGTARVNGAFVGGGITLGIYAQGSLRLDATFGLITIGSAGAQFQHFISNTGGTAGIFINSAGQLKVGANGSTFDNSAILEAVSTTKGFLPPRMTATQKNAISTPAVGLLVYQTDGTEGTYEYASTGWRILYNTGGGGGTGTVTSVDMTVPTGLSISGNPITTSGTLALTYASGYAIPTTVKQTNWDDAYTWVAAFPTQTSNASKFLKTNGTSLSWGSLLYDNGTSIGINTASPSASYILDVQTPAANTGAIFRSLNGSTGGSNPLTITSDDTWQTVFKVGNTTTREYHLGVGGSSNTGLGAGNFGIFDGVATAYRVVITNAGRVLMGTTTDAGAYTLQVTGQARLNSYTSSSSYTGTVAGYLAFTSAGNIITVADPSSTFLTVNNPAYTGVLTTGTLTYTATNHMESLQSSVNAYNQFVIQNSNAGASASSDVVVNNNLSTDTTYYGDFGINSSAFSGSGSLNLANATYLAAASGDLVLGTYTSNVIRFVVNSGTSDAAYFSTAGNLMIGQSTDAGYKTDINGTLRVVSGIVLGANTTSASTLDFTPTGAALKTSPVAGDFEVDANGAAYYTIQNSNRGVVDTEQFITLTSAYTTPTGTANTLKQLFNSTTSGALTVTGSTTYFFECYFTLSSMSGTSGTFSFGLAGTATFASIAYYSQGLKGAITASSLLMSNQTAATAQIVGSATGNTQTVGYAYIKGKFTVSTGGTIIPSFALSVAAAAVVGNNAYFRLTPVGTNTVTNVGNWS